MVQMNLTGSLPNSVSGYLSFCCAVASPLYVCFNTLYVTHMEHDPASKILLTASYILLVPLPKGFFCYRSVLFHKNASIFPLCILWSCEEKKRYNKAKQTQIYPTNLPSCLCSMNPTTLLRFLRNSWASIFWKADDTQSRNICPHFVTITNILGIFFDLSFL